MLKCSINTKTNTDDMTGVLCRGTFANTPAVSPESKKTVSGLNECVP